MNSFDRRKFIKCVICGVGITAIGNIPNHLFASSVKESLKGGKEKDLSAMFDNARELFFKKEYRRAEDLYRNIISDTPATYPSTTITRNSSMCCTERKKSSPISEKPPINIPNG